MKHIFEIQIENIKKDGKNFNWKRPQCHCGAKIHGHGFVTRFFNQFSDYIFIKRWRCPKCKAVITARPSSHWPRYQECIKEIFKILIYKVTFSKWPPWTSRQRAGHWFNKLLVNAKLHHLMKDSVLETITFYQTKKLNIN